jgi:hypothetical protein
MPARISTIIVLLGLSACRLRRGPTAADDSTFVRVMSDLRIVASSQTTDSATRAHARDSILAHYQLNSASIDSLASRIASNPDVAVQLLRLVDSRSRLGTRPLPPKVLPPRGDTGSHVAPPIPPAHPAPVH